MAWEKPWIIINLCHTLALHTKSKQLQKSRLFLIIFGPLWKLYSDWKQIVRIDWKAKTNKSSFVTFVWRRAKIRNSKLDSDLTRKYFLYYLFQLRSCGLGWREKVLDLWRTLESDWLHEWLGCLYSPKAIRSSHVSTHSKANCFRRLN